jgi:hypothetical protein
MAGRVASSELRVGDSMVFRWAGPSTDGSADIRNAPVCGA